MKTRFIILALLICLLATCLPMPVDASVSDAASSGRVDTGVDPYNARYYDAQLGRFISPDTIVQGPSNPQTLNRYSYVLNNPLKYTDPSGHFAIIPVLIAVGVGALIGGTTSAAFYGGEVLLTGRDWDWGDFGQEVGIGAAIGGATGGILKVPGVSKIVSKITTSVTKRAIQLPGANRYFQRMALLRQDYVNNVRAIRIYAESAEEFCVSKETIARTAHGMRRALQIEYKHMMDPVSRYGLYVRNVLKGYDTKYGPSYEWLISRRKTPDQIIKGAYGRNSGWFNDVLGVQ